MKQIIKAKIIYESGGFGPVEMFYSETVTINTKNISYKKERYINKEKMYSELILKKKPDISWKASIINEEVALDVINIIGEEVNSIYDFRCCDGDSIKIVVYYDDGTSKSNSYDCPCYPKTVERYSDKILKLIPKELPKPTFLDSSY